MERKISVVVVTYNGEEDIAAFLETYQKYTSSDVTLVVVDNASSDNTLDIVRERCPKARVLQNIVNRGFAGGAKQGMEYAIAHDREYIAVVNQDIRFTERWLEPLVDYLESHETCAAVQPRIMMYPDTDFINSYGNAQHFLGFGYTLGYQRKARHSECNEEFRGCREIRDSSQARDDKEIYLCESGKELAVCSGAATLFRASALQHVGLIDEAYFMYYEDSDLSWRFRLAGYTLALACDSQVYHRYEFSRSIQKFYYMERNRLITVLSNYSLRTLLLLAPMTLFMEVGMLGYSVLGSFKGRRAFLTAREKLCSYAYFFIPSTWRYLSRKRHTSQHLRRISDREITRLFVATIEFQDIDNIVLRRIANPMTHWYWQLVRRFL